MTWEVGFLLLMLAAMVYLFMSARLPVDLTAFLGLLVLIIAGLVSPEQAFSGFSSNTVITMLSIFIIGGALRETGVADVVAARIHAWVGSREAPLIGTIMLSGGLVSAFMNNMAATAVLMPAVGSISRRSGLAPSRLFMPLAVGAVLGGMLTLVGTPPNILASELLTRNGLAPLRLFDFLPVGGVLLLAGTLFMVTVGRKILPSRSLSSGSLSRELAQVYQLQAKLFSIRIPAGSQLSGQTLRKTRLGSALEIQVVGIVRGGDKILAPPADTILRGGDVLLVEGRLQDVQELFRMQGVEVHRVQTQDLPRPSRGFSGLRLSLSDDSAFRGKTLRQLQFRESYGVTVVGIRRAGNLVRESLGSQILEPGDEIIAVGSRAALRKLAAHPGLKVQDTGLGALHDLGEELHLIRIPETSSLAGGTLGGTRLGELAGVTVGGLIREGETHLAVSPEQEIRAGDRLLLACKPSRILHLLEIGEVALESEIGELPLESEDVGVIEAVVAPRSSAAGQTLRQLSFRDRYGLHVLALWREGRPVHTNLADHKLQVGDALLLQGPWEKIVLLGSNPDFILLSQSVQAPRRREKAPVAAAGLLMMIFLVVTALQPIHVAAFAGAMLVLAAGALRMEEAYRLIDWKSVFLVAALLPFAYAMEQSGGALLLAGSAIELVSSFGPLVLLAALVILASIVSQALDGTLAVIVLAPIAIETAQRLGVSPLPLTIGVAMGASIVFLTPFSGKAGLLVMGAGGYRSMDFFKVGAPLTLLLIVLLLIIIPLVFPF